MFSFLFYHLCLLIAGTILGEPCPVQAARAAAAGAPERSAGRAADDPARTARGIATVAQSSLTVRVVDLL